MKRVLLAGGTGYLGGYIAQELLKQSYPVRALVRDPARLKQKDIGITDILQAELTRPESLKNCCSNIDVYRR